MNMFLLLSKPFLAPGRERDRHERSPSFVVSAISQSDSCGYLVIRHVDRFIRPPRFEMLAPPAEEFHFTPELDFGPEGFFGHGREFLIAGVSSRPVGGVVVSTVRVLREEPFRL
jgi:hypothetical protein